MKMKRVNNLSIHKMHKVSKKFKIRKIKKTNLNKKNKNTKRYNLIGGFLKDARQLFKANYDKIKENLMKEKDIITPIKTKYNNQNINNNLNPEDPSYQLKEANKIKNIELFFNDIITYLTIEADKYFATQEYIEIPEKFVTHFIDDNINWIFKCYIEGKFYFNSPETDNLLFANYNKFLELYTKLKFLFNNSRQLNEVIKKIIRTDEKTINYRQIILDTNPQNFDNITFEEYKDNIEQNTQIILKKHIILNSKNNELQIKTKSKNNILNTFTSLKDLYNFINNYKDEIPKIEQLIKDEKNKKGVIQNPEKHIDIILNTQQLYIYKLKTFAAAMYYGHGSNWCTSKSTVDTDYNSAEYFLQHTKNGNLYIIQAKDNVKNNVKNNFKSINNYKLQKSMNKYQIEIANTFEIKDNNNNNITINEIIKHFNEDKELINFFNDLTDYKITYTEENKLLSIDINKNFEKFYYFNHDKYIEILKKYINENKDKTIKKLKFNANIKLGDSLKDLSSLTDLSLGAFNQPLGDSLKDLSSLTSLSFGNSFNQPLGDSLKDLSSLRDLTIYNQNYEYKNELQEILKLLDERKKLNSNLRKQARNNPLIINS